MGLLINKDSSFVLEAHYFQHLVRACSRLYAPEPLTPDERRDMAHVLDLVRQSAHEFNTDELNDAIVRSQL